ncbi:perm-4 [Pristionchus pacificus]|uniref:Perm-4 n=1 Tax=Pristionchus pacificus TaxID=54126 RepID=A0A2A6BF98_PRIPA|nr:perm-4 [Pristionchus pacificus]|eukprot:PDM64536.1 perm-4 [Pristionchus pacificus]
MRSLLVLLSCTAIALTAATPKPTLKEGDGHRHHHRSRWGGGGVNPLVDRNVCDLEASVLVVVEGGRRGYNKARRIKCADSAAADEDSCMVCCQNAARRDTNIRNEDIFGFLSVIDHFEKDSRSDSWEDSHDDDYNRRPKRDAEEKEYKRAEESLEDFEPIKNFKNLKCLCCAPRRQLPPPPVYTIPVPVNNWGPYQAYAQPPHQQSPPQYSPAAAPTAGYAVPAADAAPQPYPAAGN